MKHISRNDVSEILEYNNETGLFFWKIKKGIVNIGDQAGTLTKSGYVRIGINRCQYLAHRLAIFLDSGEMPIMDIDHINGVRTDNRISNLRCVARSINSQNQRKANAVNKSGYLGVRVYKYGFQALISVDGKKIALGTFKNAGDAHNAYVIAKRKFHAGCTL